MKVNKEPAKAEGEFQMNMSKSKETNKRKVNQRQNVFVAVKKFIAEKPIKSFDEFNQYFKGLASLSSDINSKDDSRYFKEEIQLENGDVIRISNQIGNSDDFYKPRKYSEIMKKLAQFGIYIEESAVSSEKNKIKKEKKHFTGLDDSGLYGCSDILGVGAIQAYEIYVHYDRGYQSVFDFIDGLTVQDKRNKHVFDEILNGVRVVEDPYSKPIKFFEKAKTEIYKLMESIADKDVKEKVRDLINTFYNPKPGQDVEDVRPQLSNMIEMRKMEGEDIQKLATIAGLLKEEPYYYISGTYNHERKLITLYLKNITSAPKKEIIFAHELFHAYHHHLIDVEKQATQRDPFDCKNEYDSKIVLESLASSFEHAYARKCKYEKEAKDIEMNWKKYPIEEFPYSGAKYIKKPVKFRKILFHSLESMAEAYLDIFL